MRTTTLFRAAPFMLFWTGTAIAQNADSLRADSAFRRGDWPTSARLYSSIAAQAPSQGMAWLRLGIARQGLNDLDPAISAFEKAVTLGFQVSTATYRLARLHARKGNSDRAFAYLEQLVPTRAVPVAILDTLSEFSELRRDARYQVITTRMNALRYPCRSRPESRQFDFWIGDWDVTPFQAPPSPTLALLGTNRVDLQLESCMLVENWAGAGPGGGEGKSINFYDTNRNAWRQVWVADGGGSLDYIGGQWEDLAARL
ncbi:MAG TPA: tetratricopeptide repeat protein [Gemmatimonadaceae bacterium]|nr:tetratricopeptide repeat protein [Gemmatimonadaceae bacterium]